MFEVGKRYFNNEGCEYEISKKINSKKFEIFFIGSEKEKIEVNYSAMFYGKIKNNFFKSVCNVGYYGVGKYTSKDRKIYLRWKNMIQRCYGNYSIDNNLKYKEIEVCEEWHNFQNFADWFEKNSIDDFELDKDLLQMNVSNKIYSPETCVFLPRKINSFFNNKSKRIINENLGVRKKKNVFNVRIRNFNDGKEITVTNIKNINEAKKIYFDLREEQALKAREYMRKLGHWSEEIIQLVI